MPAIEIWTSICPLKSRAPLALDSHKHVTQQKLGRLRPALPGSWPATLHAEMIGLTIREKETKASCLRQRRPEVRRTELSPFETKYIEIEKKKEMR